MATSAIKRRVSAARGGLAPAFLLAYVVAAAAIGLLVHFGGIWNLLGNTRVLDLLSRGGIVALTDADQGIVQGVPSPEYYVNSQDPIDWELVVLAAGLLLLVWLAKGIQFHWIARLSGVQGGMGLGLRTWVYGHGINRLLPYEVGRTASADALEAQGTPPGRASQVVFLASVVTGLEIALIALYALVTVGLSQWTSQLFWAVVILLVAWLMVRPEGSSRETRRETRRAIGRAIAGLATRPAALARLLAIGVASILLFDAAAYALTQAFTSANVIINIEGDVLLMAIVAGYVARLVAFTPGGLGQWEWGFAAALYAGGLGFPESVTAALLLTVLRYVTGAVVFAVVRAGYGVGTDLSRVLQRVRSSTTTSAEGTLA